jgi:DnaJ-class molecular chaperone
LLENFYVLVFLAICAGGYLLSLRLHPRIKCGACKGKGSHRGLVFSYADRACLRCRGTGRLERLGHRLFFKAPK